MKKDFTRRDFLKGGAAAGVAALFPHGARAGAPAVHVPGDVRAVVVASANGNTHTHDGTVTAVEKAFTLMTEGEDVLDAIVAGVNILELDPADTSVGFGGLPNAEGVVQLDASCMHGPKRRAGGVAALEGVRTPVDVARLVMNTTDHHLLVGSDAQRFARQMGFTIEDDLNSERSRMLWLEWKRRTDPDRYLDPESRAEAGHEAGMSMIRDGLIDPEHYYGTINCNAINSAGEICGATTTSGLAWKIPGRVGDSPILGAGLYVDGDIGAAGSTGRGEANLYSLASFLIVENMRNGMSPLDAGLGALRRIRDNTIERRLLNDRGLPNFGINFYVVNAVGDVAGVSMYEGPNYAVCTERGPETLPCEPLLPGRAED